MKKTIYLYKSGTFNRKDFSLMFETKESKEYIPIEQVDCIFCFGDININKRVLSLLNGHNVSLVFFNYYGNYMGRFQPKKYTDGKILIQQIEAYQTKEVRLHLANAIIVASLKNAISLLKYYRKQGYELDETVIKLEEMVLLLKECATVEEILLIEAQAKKLYYGCFDTVLKTTSFEFEIRSKNPPLNEINACLSYGYALLYGLILSELDKSRLLPQISFIHSLTKETDSLQFDLADIFKPILIDRMLFRVCRRQQLKKEFFTFKSDGACFLNKEGIQFVINEFETLLEQSIKIGNKYYSYRSLIRREIYNLTNTIKGKAKEYKPFVMRW